MKIFDRFKEIWDRRKARELVRETQERSAAAAAERKDRKPKYRRRGYRLRPGFDWNPLIGYPRNKGCWCGSGDKAKRCCMPHIARALPRNEAAVINEIWPKLLEGKLTIPAASAVQEKRKKLNAPAPAPEKAAA